MTVNSLLKGEHSPSGDTWDPGSQQQPAGMLRESSCTLLGLAESTISWLQSLLELNSHQRRPMVPKLDFPPQLPSGQFLQSKCPELGLLSCLRLPGAVHPEKRAT